MRICIDFDHVLVETSKAILKTYNDEFNDNIKYNKGHQWNLTGLIPDKHRKWVLDSFDSNEQIFRNMKPIKDSVEILKELSKEHRLVIVTQHSGIGMYYKEKVIKELFPFCDIAFISGADKSVTCGDIFIDDRPECLNSVKGNYKYIWCFGVYNWNKNWDGIRVNSWKEVKHKIDEIMRRNL